MLQENIEALVKLILSDKRLQDLIKHTTPENGELTLIENEEGCSGVPDSWKGNVFCQEHENGSERFLSLTQVLGREWKTIRFYDPSLNSIAKLAAGIADEPILRIFQTELTGGKQTMELICTSNVNKIKNNAYKKLFTCHLETLKSFGIAVTEGFGETEEQKKETTVKNAVSWDKKALTERDLRDFEKGTTITIGKKCIITSLGLDMARRKSIQICREGEIK